MTTVFINHNIPSPIIHDLLAKQGAVRVDVAGIRQKYDSFMSNCWKSGDISLGFNVPANDFCTCNRPEMNQRLLLLRKMYKNGQFMIRKENNISKATGDGRVWHLMIVHALKDGVFDEMQNRTDMFGFLLNVTVNGLIEAYISEEIRDYIFTYITTGRCR
jgi:hypothetical protein